MYAKVSSRDGEVDKVTCAGPGLEPGGSVVVDRSDEITDYKVVDLERLADPGTSGTGNTGTGTGAPTKEVCKVANLVGMSSKQAVDLLKQNKCVAKLTFWWVTFKKDNGKVLKQNTKPESYGAGSDIGLTVGRKATAKWCRVPRVVGKSESSVTRFLKGQQCNVVFRYKRVKSRKQHKRVISQSKRGNVRTGSTLSFTIGWKK